MCDGAEIMDLGRRSIHATDEKKHELPYMRNKLTSA